MSNVIAVIAIALAAIVVAQLLGVPLAIAAVVLAGLGLVLCLVACAADRRERR